LPALLAALTICPFVLPFSLVLLFLLPFSLIAAPIFLVPILP
jgi:hypothetical protein